MVHLPFYFFLFTEKMPLANSSKKFVQSYFNGISFLESGKKLRQLCIEKFQTDPGYISSYERQSELIKQLQNNQYVGVNNPAKNHQQKSKNLVTAYEKLTGLSVKYPQNKQEQDDIEREINNIQSELEKKFQTEKDASPMLRFVQNKFTEHYTEYIIKPELIDDPTKESSPLNTMVLGISDIYALKCSL